LSAFPEDEMPLPLGITGETGRPIAGLSDAIVESVLPQREESRLMSLSLKKRSAKHFGTIGGSDPDDLRKVGWGVIYGRGIDSEIKAAMKPLLNLRSEAEPLRIFEDEDAPHPDETAEAWLDRHGASMNVVDPSLGVPFYILIVAPVDSISFEFQYSLDLYWAVGRIWFKTPKQFSNYVESVVCYETINSVRNAKKITVFATEHDFDKATQLFMQQVARPIIGGEGIRSPLGKEQGFKVDTYLREGATKENLINILRGSAGGSPSVLFSGTHGIQFGFQDQRQSLVQGAVVCQDWEGYGNITEKDWFSASDIPKDASFHGLIHVFFACHGAGCTEFDDFDRSNREPRRIAKKPFLSMLPQALLSHKNGGALAVLAHVERAWVYSFQGRSGRSQTQGFRDVLDRLLLGWRIGHATDSFNMRWAVLSTQLSEKQHPLNRKVSFKPSALARLWIARDDARNFVVLGDPAVRLRIDRVSEYG
jgi:hypothetical protein